MVVLHSFFNSFVQTNVSLLIKTVVLHAVTSYFSSNYNENWSIYIYEIPKRRKIERKEKEFNSYRFPTGASWRMMASEPYSFDLCIFRFSFGSMARLPKFIIIINIWNHLRFGFLIKFHSFPFLPFALVCLFVWLHHAFYNVGSVECVLYVLFSMRRTWTMRAIFIVWIISLYHIQNTDTGDFQKSFSRVKNNIMAHGNTCKCPHKRKYYIIILMGHTSFCLSRSLVPTMYHISCSNNKFSKAKKKNEIKEEEIIFFMKSSNSIKFKWKQYTETSN